MWTIPFLIITVINICILIYGGFLYLAKGREKEASNERNVMFGYSGTLFCFACSLIFYMIFLYFLPGVYKENAFYVNLNNMNDFTEILHKISYFFFYVGQILFILVFELNFKRTRYVLTFIGSFMILMVLIDMASNVG